MVGLLNQDRTAAGLVPVQTDSRLMAIARARSVDMATKHYFSHTQPDGRNVFDILNAQHITWYGAGEIIAWNNYPGLDLSTANANSQWMNSPGHKAIVLSTTLNYVGVGLAIDASTGKKLWTAVYIKGPDRTGARSTTSKPTVAAGRDRRDEAGHGQLDRRGRPPPGPDVRLQLLAGPAADRWRGVDDGLCEHDEAVDDARARRRPHLRVPDGGPATRPATGAPGRRSGRHCRNRLGWSRPGADRSAVRPQAGTRALDCSSRSGRARLTASTSGRSRAVRGHATRFDPANARWASSVVGEGNGERLVRERVEPVLPPHAQDARAPRPCDPPAARSARRAGRRTASAGRSSPSAAWGPGRRPPRCSRSRRATRRNAAVPDERVERPEERDAAIAATRWSPGSHLRLRLSQQCRLTGDDEPAALHTVDLDREQRAGLDQVVEGELSSRRPHRQPVLDTELAREIRPGEELVRARGAQQPVAAVARQQLVADLFARRMPLREELRREQPLDQVVHALVAFAPGDAEHAGLGERLEDRPDLVRRPPVPVDRLARPDVA